MAAGNAPGEKEGQAIEKEIGKEYSSHHAGTHTVGTAVRSHPRERKEIESARSADGVESGCSFNSLI